ncbi:MAG: S8 family serine peptidase, partial [Candidatus Cloacimonetes bacterium]|nr:S8 family serine peptidase [Candidatus Cloacimonadota bacterium]
MRASYNETDGELGAFVVATNASFGVNYANPANYPLWCAMYDTLGYVGVLSTGATMNINVNVDETGDMPTACDSDYLITVTNTTHNDLKNSSAAYGPTTIDLGAPGTTIKSTDLSNTYTYKTGTSMATPQVTGAIGLLFSAAPVSFLEQYEQNPSEVALLIKQYILDGVDPLEDLDGITVSGGRLNIFNSLLLLPSSVIEVSGHITEDTTWDVDTVKVVGDIFVDDAVTLTINPGVYVEFQGYYKIDVQGTLIAEGTNPENITFTIADTTGFSNFETTDGSWNGITFDETPETNDASILNYCTINYCKSLSYTLRHAGAALYFNNYSDVIISNCIIEFHLAYSGGGIACINNSSPYIGYNLIDGNTATYQGGGIYCDLNSSPLIEHNFIYSNQAYQGGAIYCSGSSSLIYGNVIQYNTNSP